MASELSLRSGYAMYPRSRQQQGAVMSKELVRTACLVPDNLRHDAAVENPIIHVLYNIFQRLKLQSGTKFENLVTFIALYKIVSPAWRGLRTLFLRFFASQVTMSEYDPTAQEIVRWMSSKTFEAGFHTKAVITAAGQQDQGFSYHARHLGVKERFTQRLCTMFGYGASLECTCHHGSALIDLNLDYTPAQVSGAHEFNASRPSGSSFSGKLPLGDHTTRAFLPPESTTYIR